MKKIKTFEDACAALKIKTDLPDVSLLPEAHQKAIIAHYKLIVIAQALNGGWVPDWNNTDEGKYFPWFDMEGGFVLLDVNYYYTYSYVSSRLCFKSRELGKYAAEQFTDLYKDYMVI